MGFRRWLSTRIVHAGVRARDIPGFSCRFVWNAFAPERRDSQSYRSAQLATLRNPMLQARLAEESPLPRRATLFCDLPETEFAGELRRPRREARACADGPVGIVDRAGSNRLEKRRGWRLSLTLLSGELIERAKAEIWIFQSLAISRKLDQRNVHLGDRGSTVHQCSELPSLSDTQPRFVVVR